MSDCESDDREEIALEEDTVKILLATDCHLGYEHCTKRLQENDSFITFEEILKHAQDNNVDFLLLGGDLFHEAKPTQKVVLQCMKLLKEYCLGDREIGIQFLSNPEIIFSHTSQKVVNYEDPNLNVGLPVFSIHGNHDNPSFESTGSMDLLGASGLINYFGKWSDLTNVVIPPLVFNKGNTYVSLYGLSYMNDQRLSRLLRQEKVTLLQPIGIPEPFNIFVLHQNRAKHTENGYIPEDKLPAFLDLVFWGHEHECRVSPETIEDNTCDPPRRYHITQPGSSVATSLSEGEAVEKRVGLLKINKKRFRLDGIKLETVRPFVFENIHLKDEDIKEDYTKPVAETICNFIDKYIEDILLPRAGLQITGHEKQPTLPLIRLRIFYSADIQLFDTMIITRKYCDKVANPRDMIIFRKDRTSSKLKENLFDESTENENENDIDECFRHDDDSDWNVTVQGSIKKYFNQNPKNQLIVLSVDGLNEALERYVTANDDDAFLDVIKHQCKKNREYMRKYDIDDEKEIIEQLKEYRNERLKAAENDGEKRDIQELLDDEKRKSRKKNTQSKVAEVSNDEDNDDDDDEERPTKGRGKGSRARGKARARGTARGKGKIVNDPNFFGMDPITPGNRNAGSSTSANKFRAKAAATKNPQMYIEETSDSD